jgi:DNA-binding transcriptional regulator of glucitol operon
VRQFFLSPRWLAGHALVLVLAATCVRLGIWQWDRAHEASGGPQNYGYALQWPLFAVFGVVAWVRILRIERERVETPPKPLGAPMPAADWQENPAFDDDGDEELAAYNRHLAQLNAREQRSRR